MPHFDHSGLTFHYLDQGAGTPFVFQHGLGADAHQPEGLYQPQPGIRLLAMDCRGHGQTRPLGDPALLKFSTFADDLAALLTSLGIAQTVVGGLSMGAGVALNFALRYPERTLGLVLSRPAWLDRPLPDNLRTLPWVAGFIRQYGAVEGLARFQTNADYALLRRRQPDLAESLARQLADPRAEDAVERLERLPNDAPNRKRAEWATIRVPTLVLATRRDALHPAAYAETLAWAIPGAVLCQITPRSVSDAGYRSDTQSRIGEFLRTHFAP